MTDSDSVNLGSNPSSPATKRARKQRALSSSNVLGGGERLTNRAPTANRPTRKSRHSVGMIYFLVGGSATNLLTADVVKIGFSAGDAQRRLYDVGTGCPFPLEMYASIPGTRALERRLHTQTFAKFRIHKEWFLWCSEIEDWIDNFEIDAGL